MWSLFLVFLPIYPQKRSCIGSRKKRKGKDYQLYLSVIFPSLKRNLNPRSCRERKSIRCSCYCSPYPLNKALASLGSRERRRSSSCCYGKDLREEEGHYTAVLVLDFASQEKEGGCRDFSASCMTLIEGLKEKKQVREKIKGGKLLVAHFVDLP